MEKWEDLKVYRLLDPDDIPAEFKRFAEKITINLAAHGFKLKQSKTIKQIYRVTDDLIQTIHVENTNPYEKNKKEIKINLSIKPLFTDNIDALYHYFDAWKLSPPIKMGYVLSQHNDLLAEHLTHLFIKFVLPFFDQFSDSKDICEKSDLLFNDHSIAFARDLLIIECAFKNRNENCFLPLLQTHIDHDIKELEKVKKNPQYALVLKARLDKNKQMLDIFLDDQLYKEELNRLKNNEKQNLKKLKVK